MLGAPTKRENAPSLLKTYKFETIYGLIVTVFSPIISSPKGTTQPIDALRLLKARNGHKNGASNVFNSTISFACNKSFTNFSTFQE